MLVADLGVAKAAAQGSGLTQVVGTPAYIAPEQAMGRRLDARADVHSLGAVAYVLLTGYLVREDGLAGLVDAKLPPPPSQVADVPTRLDPVILKALAPDPEDRWPDVESFISALVGAPLTMGATPASAEPVRRSSLWLVLICVVVLVATFAGSFYLVDQLSG